MRNLENVLIIIFILGLFVFGLEKSYAGNLTIFKQGTGDGYIYSAGNSAPGIKCGSTCSHNFADNSWVRFLVKGDPVTWGGDCNANGFVEMGITNKNCTATFTATDMPDVSFTNSDWTTTTGATIQNNGVLDMQGNPNGIVKAELDMPVTPDMLDADIHLIGEVLMNNIESPSNYLLAPQFTITDISSGNPENRKSYGFIDGSTLTWESAGIVYRINNSVTNIRLTVMLPKVSGLFRVKNLRLTRTPLEDKPAYPFPVPDNISCNLIVNTNDIKPFNNNLLGLNQYFNEWQGNLLNYDDQAVKDLVADLDIPLLRFPGGTHANWYDWETDNFINPMPADIEIHNNYFLNHYQDRLENNKTFKFNSYTAVLENNSIGSSLVFNVLHNTPEESVARLENRLTATSQHPAVNLKYVEMGNENYLLPQQSGNISADANNQELAVQQYITHSKAHINAMKTINDDILYGINIHKPYNNWNNTIATAAETEDYFDVIVPHLYIMWPFNPAFLDFNTAKKALLSYNFAKEELDGWHQQFPNKPMVISEWGSRSLSEDRMMMNPLAALSSADLFFAIMSEEEHIEAAMQHDFFGGPMGAYRELPPNNRIVKTPIAFQYELIKDVLQDNQLLGTTYESTEMTTDTPFIRALAARTPQGNINIFAINKAPKQAAFNINIDSAVYNGAYTIESYSESDIYMPKIYNLSDNVLQKQAGTGQITLPPYSINVIKITPNTEVTNQNGIPSELMMFLLL